MDPGGTTCLVALIPIVLLDREQINPPAATPSTLSRHSDDDDPDGHEIEQKTRTRRKTNSKTRKKKQA